MNSSTLASLTTLVRTRMNLSNLITITDAEIQLFLRSSLARLYNLLVRQWKDYYVSTKLYDLAAGQESYPLPGDFRAESAIFLRARSGTSDTNLRRYQLRKFNLNQLSVPSADLSAQWQWPFMYRIMGRNILFTPIPAAAYTQAIELWYVPQFQGPLTINDSIDVNLPNGWESWVELDTCVQVAARMREEKYYAMYSKERSDAEKDLIADASIRSEQPEQMTDVFATANSWGFYDTPGQT